MRFGQKHCIFLPLLTVLFLCLLMGTALAEAQVTGTLWLDRNVNGKMDATEKVIAGGRVYLEQKTSSGAKEVAVKKINNSGQFAFSVSSAGEYRLRIELPKDYYFTVPGKESAALPAVKQKGYTPYFSVAGGDKIEKNIGATMSYCNISLVAFEDSNSNGGRANNEPALRKVVAELLYEYDGNTYVVTKTTSDKTGNLSIWELSPGTYRLRVTLPDNYVIGPMGEKRTNRYNCIKPDSTPGKGYSDSFTAEGGHTVSLGIGAVKTGSLKGTLWLDSNSNGKKDSSEGGLTSATIKLTSVALQLTRTTKPNAKGEYSFAGLQPGNYKLSVQLPKGYIFTYPGVSALSSISSYGELAANVQVEKTVNVKAIGAMKAASLSVSLYIDDNMNGKQDSGEKPLSGATVVATQNGEKVETVKTNSNGVAAFSTLRSGSVSLRCTLPSGYIFLPVGNGVFDTSKVTSDSTGELKLSGSQTKVSAAVTVPGAISGRIFEDPYNTGLYNDDCDPLPDFRVQAVNAQGKVIASAVTGRDGAYTLSPLPADTYTVRFLLSNPYVASPHTQDNDIIRQTPSYGMTDTVQIAADQKVSGMDGAVFRAGVVDGYVRNSLGDDGIKGVKATLLDENGAPVSSYSYGTTNDKGYFMIKGVLPGTYTVRYTLPGGAAFSEPETDERELSSDAFSITSGAELHLPKLAAVYTAELSGFIGHQDGTTPVDASILLTAKSSGKQLETTAQNGNYSFTGLRPDTYTMAVTLPENYVFGQLSGSPFGWAAKNTASASIQLSPQEKKTANVLASLPVDLTGVVFYDANSSGKQDKDESGAASRTLTLWLNKTKVADLTTDKKGAFSAAHLVPGNYTLRMALDDNEVIVSKDAKQSGQEWLISVALSKDTSLNVPVLQYSSLAGSVWCLDGSSNGVKGIAVTLLDGNGKEVGKVNTNAKGAFSFSKLLPGKYSLSAKLPSGYLFAREQDTKSRKSYIQSQVNGKAKSLAINVAMGKKLTKIDIGIGAMGRIGDKAWLDENGNGMQDIGEAGIPDIKIELYQHGELVVSATTDVYGRYDLSNLYPGEYDMKVTMHKELKTTKVQTKFPLVASILPASDKTVVTTKVIVPSGGENLHCDLGFQLRKAGKYPDAMKKTPSKNWKPYSER